MDLGPTSRQYVFQGKPLHLSKLPQRGTQSQRLPKLRALESSDHGHAAPVTPGQAFPDQASGEHGREGRLQCETETDSHKDQEPAIPPAHGPCLGLGDLQTLPSSALQPWGESFPCPGPQFPCL